jgi:hypothetical protein
MPKFDPKRGRLSTFVYRRLHHGFHNLVARQYTAKRGYQKVGTVTRKGKTMQGVREFTANVFERAVYEQAEHHEPPPGVGSWYDLVPAATRTPEAWLLAREAVHCLGGDVAVPTGVACGTVPEDNITENIIMEVTTKTDKVESSTTERTQAEDLVLKLAESIRSRRAAEQTITSASAEVDRLAKRLQDVAMDRDEVISCAEELTTARRAEQDARSAVTQQDPVSEREVWDALGTLIGRTKTHRRAKASKAPREKRTGSGKVFQARVAVTREVAAQAGGKLQTSDLTKPFLDAGLITGKAVEDKAVQSRTLWGHLAQMRSLGMVSGPEQGVWSLTGAASQKQGEGSRAS